ncbi:unnamed protein product [Meloidogyne enterolobii]|uniref:Uncharacterized protein n=1 Tax=Meloidogyne enterolobii TaxID=390850 RepID=A0ACB0XQ68_MELEN
MYIPYLNCRNQIHDLLNGVLVYAHLVYLDLLFLDLVNGYFLLAQLYVNILINS